MERKCLKVDVGYRVKTNCVSVVDFTRLYSDTITCCQVVGNFQTFSQYGDAMRGDISFQVKVQNREGNIEKGKVVVYSCMKEVWRTTLGFHKFQDFNPTDTLNGITQGLKKYKDFIDIVNSRGLCFMGEDTRLEITFTNMSIKEAFDIIAINDMKSIVTRDSNMLKIDSVELFDRMSKFHDMAKPMIDLQGEVIQSKCHTLF